MKSFFMNINIINTMNKPIITYNKIIGCEQPLIQVQTVPQSQPGAVHVAGLGLGPEINSVNNLLNLSSVSPRHNSNDHFSDLNVFNVKVKKADVRNINLKEKITNNFATKPKHYPPANKEWFNSIYTYNKNSSRLLPVYDKVIYKFMKSYFNLYSYKLEKKIKSRRIRNRVRRLSTNRMLVSKPELKHTNDKVIITLYVYNRQNIYYLNKIKKIASIDNMDNLLPKNLKKLSNILKRCNGLWPSGFKIDLIKRKSLILKSKISKHEKMVSKVLNANDETYNKMFKNYYIRYFKDYVYKCLRREFLSFYFRQLLLFNNSKFEERCLLPITNLTGKLYNKKVEYNLVSLKYPYLNSHIFSETLVTKLRNRKNRLLRVLKTSLQMFKLPPMNRTTVYNEIYNKKRELQNSKIKNIIPHAHALFTHDAQQKNNILFVAKNEAQHKNILSITNNILELIKNKYVSGIRIEVAGRLTRRNTAARSVFKLRYKGNIKNMDSSYKGLSTVLLRGYAKSNLQYSNLKSKIRIGSFGLKGWVSSS